MIRWYDYVAAFIAADVGASFFFNVPIFGAIATYGIYYLWMNVYCPWRLEQEYGE